MRVYKIFRPDEHAQLIAAGQTVGAPIDIADGFIHFSTLTQLSETLEKHFAHAGDLILAELESEDFGDDLKWEVSRGDALFPHLYNTLKTNQIRNTYHLHDTDDGYPLPAGLT